MLQVITNLFEGVGDNPAEYTLCDLFRVFENAFNVAFQIAIPIAVVVVIWGGFLIMTARGNTTQVEDGKKVLKNAAIGLVILTTSWLIIDTMLTVLSGGSLTDIIRKIKC